VRLGRYDLEYDCYAPEFIERHGGWSKDDYLRGRPHVYGETARLLEALLEAEAEPAEAVPGHPHLARLRLSSGDFRAEILLVKRPFYRLGIDGLPEPLEGDREHLRRHVTVDGRTVRVDLTLTADEAEAIGGMPTAEELTRVEIADRWYLLDVGDVFEVKNVDSEKSGSEVGAP
jgi:hypothetical protein